MLNINSLWYKRNPLRWLLWPLSLLYFCLMTLRKYCYKLGLFKVIELPVKIIVVGNITVGGTGKSPLTAHLAKWLQQQGMRVGLVSRGYSGQSSYWPREVFADTHPSLVGDEAVMLVQQTGCPMVVGPSRVCAVAELLRKHTLDIVISDDGLQHYALARSVEIVLLDAKRGLGNGLLLPAGPLRESSKRLQQVDFVLTHTNDEVSAYTMRLDVGQPCHISTNAPVDVSCFSDADIVAIAGIAHPERFFLALENLGLTFKRKIFPDHYQYTDSDLQFYKDCKIIMTEKDAVKCRYLNNIDNAWYLPVAAHTSEEFRSALWEILQ
jgi:tetraacyldisaccharide 4'-kinase